ncbi:MAG: hypothetical protein FJX56_02035 [Alphaproteobacteria bacterium]|nr:hypothetical protein [Alphaproteobacteria bacterium]
MMPPQAPWHANPLVEWLAREGWRIGDPATYFTHLCEQIVAQRVPLARLACHMQFRHPQLVGLTYAWTRTSATTTEVPIRHGVVRCRSGRAAALARALPARRDRRAGRGLHAGRRRRYSALTMASVTFLASPNSIIVLPR